MLRTYAGKFAAKNRQNLICESRVNDAFVTFGPASCVSRNSHGGPRKNDPFWLGTSPRKVRKVSGWRNWKWQFDPL